MSEMKAENRKATRKKVKFTDSIFFIIVIMMLLYVGVCSSLVKLVVMLIDPLLVSGGVSEALIFIIENYLVRIIPFIGIILFTGLVKGNRFIYNSFAMNYENNGFKALFLGLLIGFFMNGVCVLAAVIHGDIKLSFGFTLSQLPIILFALVCVFIQSASEEMWYRGFLYERIHANYPLWLAIIMSGLIFGFGHMFNNGVSILAVINIMVIGLAFAMAKWQSRSIWLVFGIHTGWNFMQNFFFGLPNSGVVSGVSVFRLDAVNTSGKLFYDTTFGIEGAVSTLIIGLLLALVSFALAFKSGRLAELRERSGQPTNKA